MKISLFWTETVTSRPDGFLQLPIFYYLIYCSESCRQKEHMRGELWGVHRSTRQPLHRWIKRQVEYITNNKVKSLVDTTTFTQVNKETGRIHHKQYNDTTTFTQVHQEAGRVHDKWWSLRRNHHVHLYTRRRTHTLHDVRWGLRYRSTCLLYKW